MSTLFAELISILVKASMYFSFSLYVFLQTYNSIMNWLSEILGRLDKYQNVQQELCTEILGYQGG